MNIRKIPKLSLWSLLVPAFFLTPQLGSACQCPNNRIPSGIHQGVGATCLEAENDAGDQCYVEAEENCSEFGDGSCGNFELVVTTACYFDSVAGAYKIAGRIYYHCWICGGGACISGCYGASTGPSFGLEKGGVCRG
ncbi:MAG: hypothetical protein ABJC13_26000 [Acidobacteriota bacterium]